MDNVSRNSDYPAGFHDWPEDERNVWFADETKRYRDGKRAAILVAEDTFHRADAGARYREEPASKPAWPVPIRVRTGGELLEMEIPPIKPILAPIINSGTLAMAYAPRGVGKTHLGLNIASATVTAGVFLKWRAAEPKRVLYIDGEMAMADLQERWLRIAERFTEDGFLLAAENFRLVASDDQVMGLPDLSDADRQCVYDSIIEEHRPDLIIVDNLSTLAGGVRENENDDWSRLQPWLLRQRAAGRAVLILHHSGKSGDQRGGSRKEDILNVVLRLDSPCDYSAEQGARFNVTFTKTRSLSGDDVRPFEAWLRNGDWTIGEIVKPEASADTARRMKADGATVRNIAAAIGKSVGTVHAWIKEPDNE